jgi:hypothetical protein
MPILLAAVALYGSFVSILPWSSISNIDNLMSPWIHLLQIV